METAGIYARDSSYLDRYVQLGIAGQKVISVSFPTKPDTDASDEHELLDRVFGYLEGVKDDFETVEVGLTVPTDQRAVLETVREIPYGTQVTVKELVRRVPTLETDDHDTIELVRTALEENPVPLIIPDHRVRDGPSGAPPDIEQRLRSLEGL